MNKYIKLIIVGAALSFLMVGCAVTQALPSLTVGGAANKKALVGASVNPRGLSLTAPLVNLDVPLPNLKVEDSN